MMKTSAEEKERLSVKAGTSQSSLLLCFFVPKIRILSVSPRFYETK